MASIAHSRDVLKRQWLYRGEFLTQYLRPGEILRAVKAAEYTWRLRRWSPMLTLWTFLVQVLHPGWSCRAAVSHVLAEHAAAGKALEASADPSAYCQARQHVPLSVYTQALRTVGQTLQNQVADAHRWCGRRVWVVDGSSCSMPDTPSLQKAFGQPDGQKKGCGFPVAKLVAMFCWASGAILDVAVGPYRSNELSLWRRLWDQLTTGDVVLGDRFYGAYADVAQLRERGCDGVFRLRGARMRTLDFRKGKKLGKEDRLFVWSRSSQRPRTISAQEFDALPATLTVRVLRFHTQTKGFRSRTIVVVTTLLDPLACPAGEIAALYGDRWTVELRIREIKTTLRMDVLRNKSPDTIHKEIRMHLIAYNLIRALMWQAAHEHGRPLHRLSFAGTAQHWQAMAPYLCRFAGAPRAVALYRLLLSWIASDLLPQRPHRVEPRVLKRRLKPYDLLNRPRHQMRKRLLR